MTETEKKALALVNEVCRSDFKDLGGTYRNNLLDALLLAIEQHEAFRQEVSGAVEAVFAGYHDAPIPWVVMRRKLEPFIIPKPDPLVEALNDLLWAYDDNGNAMADQLRAALAARGLEIREKQP